MADKWVQLKGANGDRLFPASKMDLLWTNASPTSGFNAQTITISGMSNYSKIVIFSHMTNNQDHGSVQHLVLKKDTDSVGTMIGQYDLKASLRRFTLSGNDLIVGNGSYSGGTDNVILLPYRIYGIK